MNHSHYEQFALEITMQDVLDNMTELSTEMSYEVCNGGFEILSIEPEQQEDNILFLPTAQVN